MYLLPDKDKKDITSLLDLLIEHFKTISANRRLSGKERSTNSKVRYAIARLDRLKKVKKK